MTKRCRQLPFLALVLMFAIWIYFTDFRLLRDSTGAIVVRCNPLKQAHVPIPPFEESSISAPGMVNSIPGTTGQGVPGVIREVLTATGKDINEEATSHYGSQEAVDTLEDSCGGWDPVAGGFKTKTNKCLESANFQKDLPDYSQIGPELLDIVTPSIRNLGFLNDWREFFQGYHIIIIQDGDPNIQLEIPDWVDYELYNRNDIVSALGKDEWIISKKDASLRNFGFLVSQKPYIYTIDDDCLPAKDADGYYINPLTLHLKNLLAPSSPYFFNTLYDPYNDHSDFVRGYPYSLRSGVSTAISHGLWMQTPDYDAITQLLKPEERITKMHDMAITIPANVFYPMCSMNVAFSREQIGPAFMQGLMGEGQPWGRYDDMFAGWASKAVADHLHVGVKSGRPYIRHSKKSNPFTNLKKEYKGLWWQESLIRFFQDEVVFTDSANTPQKAYLELADQIEARFNETNVYFSRLSNAMRLWIKAWDDIASGKIQPKPSRRSSPNNRVYNIGDKSHCPLAAPHMATGQATSSTGSMRNFFAYWEPKGSQQFVTKEDIASGHKWKTYVLPLPEAVHRAVYERFNTMGCLDTSCPVEKESHLGDQYVDYEAEIIIFRKLIASLNFVATPEEADLVLVPALLVTMLWWHEPKRGGCRNGGRCMNKLFGELEAQVKPSISTGKKHLFLASQDESANHAWVRRLENVEHARVATYGPGKLVVPSLNPIDLLQPSNWQGSVPLEERHIFVLAEFGVRYQDRINVDKELNAYRGTKKLERGGTTKGNMRNFQRGAKHINSVFVLCFPGDQPYQKRFYDTLASVAIPVVVKRQLGSVTTYWKQSAYRPTLERSYPTIRNMSIRELVVEVDPETVAQGKLMDFLEAIPEDEIKAKLSKIEHVRTQFLYDFEGTTKDAFSVMLEYMENWIGGNN